MEREDQYRDPLTEAIFGAMDTGESILVGRDEEDALSEAIFANLDMLAGESEIVLSQERERLLREIETVDLRDTVIVNQEVVTRDQIEDEGQPILATSPDILPEDVARTEDNWFGAHQADLSEHYFEERRHERSIFKKIILSLFVGSIIAAGAWATGVSGILPGGLPFFKNNQIASSSFFVLLNAEEDVVFEPLFLLRKNIENEQNNLLSKAAEDSSKKEDFLDAAKELNNIAVLLDNFFEDNQTFSWFNVFRKSFSTYPVSINLVGEIIRKKEAFEQNRGMILEPSNQDLKVHLSWILFWEKFLSSGGQYIIIGTHPTHQSPVLAEPATYALVKVGSGGLDIVSSGRVADLNAALSAKIIPPEPVQVVKTNFDFFESGWFLSTESFGSVFSNLFNRTTNNEVDGVLLFGHEFLSEIARKQGFVLDPDSSQWPAQLVSVLARRSPTTWKEIEQMFKRAMRTHQLSFYFKDENLQKFALLNNMAMGVNRGSKEDSFSFGIRSWDGDKIAIDDIEYSPEFFADGSIMSRLSLVLRNQDTNFKNSYLKLYIPLSSIPLKIEGFSPKRDPVSFNYEDSGFLPNNYFGQLDNYDFRDVFKEIDFFKEGDFMVIGGWVNMSPLQRQTISVTYRLPFRLNWQRGVDNYTLKIFKPGGFTALPFRFRSLLSDDIEFSWQNPQGFLTDGLAEYQTILREDTTFSATIRFSN